MDCLDAHLALRSRRPDSFLSQTRITATELYFVAFILIALAKRRD